MQYGSLKQLFLSETLMSGTDTPLWHWTPNRSESTFSLIDNGDNETFIHFISADIITILDNIIKVVDEEPSEEGLISIGDVVLPHIRLWHRFVMLLRNSAVTVVIILPLLLGVLVLAILGIVVFVLWPALTVLGLVLLAVVAVITALPSFLCIRVFQCVLN